MSLFRIEEELEHAVIAHPIYEVLSGEISVGEHSIIFYDLI